jgi:hypothetical protein
LQRCLFLLLLLLMLPAAALAHDGHTPAAFSQATAVGPYQVTVEYSDWPPAARHSLRLVIVPQGGIAGKTGTYRLEPGPGVKGSAEGGRLEPYPGILSAWVIDHAGLPGQGLWTLHFTISGPEGTYSGSTLPFRVAPPPDVPMWLGWLIGLTPLYGLIWFEWRELRRVQAAIRADGGAWR